MNLTSREKDKLLISIAAIVARNRMERGVKLNHPEAIAIIKPTEITNAKLVVSPVWLSVNRNAKASVY